MTSIGLNITRRTEYYPVATAIAAAANIGLNFALIPRFGIMGAAYANGLAYALQAAIAYHFSQRVYPIRYEFGRLARVVAAAAIAYAAALALPAMPAIWGVLARGTTVVFVMIGGLWLGGFFRPEELRVLDRFRRSRRASTTPVTPPADTTELAGEIVSTDLPDEAIPGPSVGERVR
jgi:O-antigen/teichoic acid export membrane protein